jgi:antitoxin (DNA-binding transcriptional repressor) of toxin-antitoxin stability system
MLEPGTFKPEQLVSARDLQRGMASVLDRLDSHGSLLVLQHGSPVAVLSALPATPKPHQGGSDA